MPWIKGGNLSGPAGPPGPLGPAGPPGPVAISSDAGNSSRLGSDGLLFTPEPAATALPVATASRLGGVKIGSGLVITADGTLSSASASGSYLDKRGDAMSGPLRFSPAASPSTFNGVDAYLYQHSSNSNLFLAMPGGRLFVFGADGTVNTSALPTAGSHLTNKTYVDNAIAAIPAPDLSGYLQRTGGVMTGPLRFSAITSPSTYNGTDFYAFQTNGNLLIRTPQSGTVQVNGDGTVSAAAPTAAQHLIRKDYGDNHYAAKAAFDALSGAVEVLRAELEVLRDQLGALAAASPAS